MTEHDSQAHDDEVDLLDLLLTFTQNLRLLVLGSLGVGVLALGIAFLITPTFTATTRFLPPQQQQGAAAAMLQSIGGALGSLAGATGSLKNPNDQYVSLLKSRTLQDTLIQRFKLLERYEVDYLEDARRELSNRAFITSGKDGLITIDVDDHDPAFSAELANAHVQELTKLLGRLAVTEAQQRRLFFEKQLKDTKDKLIQAEQVLQSSGVNISAVKANPDAAVEALAQLQANIAAQEVKVATMRSYLTDEAPEFRQALTELRALRGQLRQVESSQPKTKADSDYVAKFRDFKYYETLFELMAKQYEIARVDESREGAVIQVVDVALPPEKKSRPKKALIAVAVTFATGFLLLIFVFIREALRNSRRDATTAGKLEKLRLAWRAAIGKG